MAVGEEMKKETMEEIRAQISRELTEHIIPFWMGLRDDEHGGYYGLVNYDLTVDRRAEKGCILNSRILWFFSNAYLKLRDEKLLAEAEHAYRFLRDCCEDKEKGGVFWSVTYDGRVLDGTKHTYNQAFAVYALSSFYRASGRQEALQLAQELFDLIENTCTDAYGYLESFDRNWVLEDNDKLSENGLLADKTMNTLLHVLEAYTELYLAAPTGKVGTALRRILRTFREKVYHPQKHRLEVFFDEKLNTISDLYSYGHDIEASWLLDRACDVLQDAAVTSETKEYTTKLAQEVYREALSRSEDLSGVHTAMNNECFKGIVDTTRVWWVQAEAMVGFHNCYEKTGDARYQEITAELWEYIKACIIDKREGSEWFWDVNKNGIPESRKPIVEPWKCPYHNVRMCLMLGA